MIKSLSIIFPTYNEAKRLSKTFNEIIKFKKNFLKINLEIVFIDDGSVDNSTQLIETFIKKNKFKKLKIKKLFLKKNMGKGYALKKGVNLSTKLNILTSDVDLSVPLSQLTTWEKKNLIKKNLIIFGSRNLDKSVVVKKKSRFLLGYVFNILTKVILNIKLKDTQCGFKLYKKRIAKLIFSKISTFGFAHDIELVLIARKNNIKIKELPVHWTHRSGSKVNIIFDPIKMFFNLILFRIKFF